MTPLACLAGPVGAALAVQLAAPEALLLLVVVAWVAVREARRARPALPFPLSPFLRDGVGSPDGSRRVGGGGPLRTARSRTAALPALLLVLGLAALVVAVARPVDVVFERPAHEGIDLLLAVDRSSSMTEPLPDDGATSARGSPPARSRLVAALEAARAFVAARPHDRVGLLTFARYPDLVCPPTLDHAALSLLLGRVEPVASDGPEDATSIGAAVVRAVSALARGRAPASPSRVLVLLTDGEENVALDPGRPSPGGTGANADEISPVHAAQLGAALDVRVHVVVVGTRGPASVGAAPPGGGPVDASRPAVTVPEVLAGRTGGLVLRVGDAAALAAAYAHLDALERTPPSRPRPRRRDRHEPWLAAGLASVALGRVLAAAGVAGRP